MFVAPSGSAWGQAGLGAGGFAPSSWDHRARRMPVGESMVTMRAWTTAEYNTDVGVPRGRTNGAENVLATATFPAPRPPFIPRSAL